MSVRSQVGPYVLSHVIGQGGTSTVWLARHRDLGSDVVLKVLTAKFTKRARFREYFANEIRAVARLNHPNIARILDVGVERGGNTQIPVGSPYVVMEHIPGGCLHDIIPNLTWPSIRDVLLVLLDALAHAHAHDVVHLDLKPGNVLLRTEGATVSPVLTDFGISRTEDSTTPTERSGVVGTPKYMAPEQIRGEWRRTGAGTDLYALGCMAFQMVTGRVPFDAGDSYAVLRAHLKDPAPSLSPRTAVPTGMVEWIARLLEKDPFDRFETSADAAFALVQLDVEPREEWISGIGEELDMSQTTPIELTILDETLNVGALRESMDTMPMHVRSADVPPMPISWRRRADFQRNVKALGLGLVRDRVPQVVGRVPERDLLWAALNDVNEGIPRAVLIRGEVGVGTTRIAEWLARLAEEVGAGQTLMMRSAPTALEGVARAIGRKLKVAGGKAMDALPAVRELLLAGREATEDDLVDAVLLSDMVTATPNDATVADKRGAVVRGLAALSQRRAVIVVCDNVEHFRDIWSVAETLFDEAIPVLLLAATNAETLPRVGQILSHPAVQELRLTQLPDADIATMANQLVWMTPDTVEVLVKQTDGYPGRAVRWLTSWVERDLMVSTPNGFQLRRRAADESLGDAAKRAAEVLIARFSSADQRALGVAATYGTRFNTQMWFDTLEVLGVQVSGDLLERAVRLGLLDRDTSGREYEFSDILFHEEFLEALARDGLQSDVHAACAQMLAEASVGTRDPVRLERIVKHWAAAGQFENALPTLGWTALRNFHEDNLDDAHRCLAWHETLLSRADVTTRKREGWMGDIVRLWIREGEGEALPPDIAATAFEGALRAGQLVAAAEAARLNAKILRGVSIDSANEALENAANAITEAGGGGLPEIGSLWMSLGWNRGLQGHYDLAFAHFLTAERIFKASNDTHWIANLGRARGFLNLQRGNTENARTDVLQSMELARANGHRNGLAGGYMYLGEIDRHAQDYSSARSHYLAAYDLYRQNPSNRWIAECNIALCEIGESNLAETERILERLIETAQYQRKLFAPFQLALAYVEASRGEWTAYDQRVGEIVAEIRRMNHVEYDLAWLLTQTGDLCARLGHPSRAELAYEAAKVIWEGLGRETETEATRFALERVRAK